MMRRWLLSLAATAAGLAVIVFFLLREGSEAAVPGSRLTIYATEKRPNFEPILSGFHQKHPEIEVKYVELGEMALDRRFLEETASGKPVADMLLSSAMDRQVKLVNDGFAATHASANGQALPPWARWRNQAFGFTFEPSVMVFNTKLMGDRNYPISREELRLILDRDPDFWRGRIGLYDIDRNSAGFLIAAQEARQNRNFNLLLKALGEIESRVLGESADVLQSVANGELALGYNILEPEAHRFIIRGAPLKIVYPRDYTIAVLQTAVIPKNAPHLAAAHVFLEFLLSLEGQTLMELHSRMSAIHPGANQDLEGYSAADMKIGAFRPIVLGPGILLYLDPYKRRHILENWRSLMGMSPDLPVAPQ